MTYDAIANATVFAVVPGSSRQAVMASHLLRISNASQLVLVCSGREKALKGTAMKNLAILDIQEVGVASGLSIYRERWIAAIGPDHEVDSRMDGCYRCLHKSRKNAMILSWEDFSLGLIMGRFYVTSTMISSWEDFTSHIKYSQCLHSLLYMGRFYIRSKFLRKIFPCNQVPSEARFPLVPWLHLRGFPNF